VLLHAGDDIQARGSVAQVGSPLELYHRPASRFVAEFIGSPKMNVLPATLRMATAERCTVEVAGVSLEVRVDAQLLRPGTAVHVGMRPEHLRLSPAGPGNCVPGVVSHVEKLGESTLLYVDVGPQPHAITVRVEGTARERAGDRVEIAASAEDLYLFTEDGSALRRTVEVPA